MLPNFPAYVPAENKPANRTVNVTDELYDYLIRVSVNESDVLCDLRRETAKYHMARMALSPEVGQFLALLVKMIRPKKLLEVGVFTGYSTVSIAQAMPQDARLTAIDKKQMWLDIANKYLNQLSQSRQVTTVCANAVDALKEMAMASPSSIDFMFIDADKHNLLTYFECAKTLLRPGGLLVVDNTLWWGNVADEGFQDRDTLAVRAFNEKVHNDPQFNVCLLPIGDGLTLAYFEP